MNGDSVSIDYNIRQVTYVHMLLENHEVLWANGVETESFHPASAKLSALDPEDRARLLKVVPEVAQDVTNYGGFARRLLSGSEAAILQYQVA